MSKDLFVFFLLFCYSVIKIFLQSNQLKQLITVNENDKYSIDQFRQLYEKHAPALISFARKFVGRDAANDMIQDVFLKLWELKSFAIIDESIPSYLYRSVQNSCLNYLKHEVIHQEYLSRAMTELKIDELQIYAIDDILINDEQIKSLHKAIEQLPPKCREIFTLYYLEEKKNTEIALMYNISVRTVETHIYKALKILQKILLITCWLN